jgi:phosphoribosylanthranilate isomerase
MLLAPRVKVCCISSPDEAALAIRQGASALGLVSWMPSGPGVIDDAQIAAIAAAVPPPVAIAEQHAACRTTTLQLVDHVPPEELRRLHRLVPGVTLVQVIHVRDAASVDEALEAAPLVDALLLDSGNPAAAVKELGGTGRVHDWALSRRIRDSVGRPVFLAGGLTAGNVRAAVEAVAPFGLDLCSGVREDGRLHEARLSAFMRAVRATGTEDAHT